MKKISILLLLGVVLIGCQKQETKNKENIQQKDSVEVGIKPEGEKSTHQKDMENAENDSLKTKINEPEKVRFGGDKK